MHRNIQPDWQGKQKDAFLKQWETYATLLETDIALMAATGKEMHRTDNVLGQNMFPGLQ